jgi:hypothetical protein
MSSFNPIYGQGMSVAALEARTLKTVLVQGSRDLARRSSHALPKLSTSLGRSWQATTFVCPKQRAAAQQASSSSTLTWSGCIMRPGIALRVLWNMFRKPSPTRT